MEFRNDDRAYLSRSHRDASTVAEGSTRVARTVPASPREVEALLLDRDKAVLGVARRLLHVRGRGVQWAPADDLCVAGELLAEEPAGETWSLRGALGSFVQPDCRPAPGATTVVTGPAKQVARSERRPQSP